MAQKSKFKLFLLLFSLLTMSSCRLVYRTILGIDSTPKWYEQKDIEKSFSKYKIPEVQSFVLDTATFSKALLAKYKQDTSLFFEAETQRDTTELIKINSCAKDDRQFVAIRFFDRTGNPIFKLVNCDLDPPIPMSWNIDNCFDYFPPRPLARKEGEVDLKLDFILPHLKTLNGDSVTNESLPTANYFVVVMWNDIMIKPSRKLIHQIQDYTKKYESENIAVLYVNNHNQTMWRFLDKQQRATVKSELLMENEAL